MNILIKGMEKPKSCYNHCLEGFIANEEIGCPLKDYAESHQYKDRIHTDCPLIEIDLVRCGECIHFEDAKDDICGYCYEHERDIKDNDFCSYGERRSK